MYQQLDLWSVAAEPVPESEAPVYDEGVPEGWLTVRQAAEKSGLKPQQIRDAIRRENLNAEQHGTIWLIREEDLEAFQIRKPGRPKKRRGRPPKIQK